MVRFSDVVDVKIVAQTYIRHYGEKLNLNENRKKLVDYESFNNNNNSNSNNNDNNNNNNENNNCNDNCGDSYNRSDDNNNNDNFNNENNNNNSDNNKINDNGNNYNNEENNNSEYSECVYFNIAMLKEIQVNNNKNFTSDVHIAEATPLFEVEASIERKKYASEVLKNKARYPLYKVEDKVTGRIFVIDCGAVVSVCPASAKDRMSEVVGNLIAANETPVEVYGRETLNIDIGMRRLYKVEVLKASVPTPILGLDFLCSNNFILNFKENILIDAETNFSIKLIGNSRSNDEILDCKFHDFTLKLSCNLPNSSILSLVQLINNFKHLFENPYLKLNSKLKIEQMNEWAKFGNSGNASKKMNGSSDVTTGRDWRAAVESPLPERVEQELKSNFPYEIKVKGGPINIKARRLPASLYNKTKAELQKLLEAGVINRSNSAWGFPINVLRKDETEVRVVADLRQLNAISIRDCYALPNLGNVANKIAKCKIFTKLDLTKAFYNLPLHENSKKYFTINTPFGSFSYNTIVEGHCNSAGAFLRFMHILLADLPGVCLYR